MPGPSNWRCLGTHATSDRPGLSGPSGLSGSSGLSGLFCCLTQRNQTNQINETDQIMVFLAGGLFSILLSCFNCRQDSIVD